MLRRRPRLGRQRSERRSRPATSTRRDPDDRAAHRPLPRAPPDRRPPRPPAERSLRFRSQRPVVASATNPSDSFVAGSLRCVPMSTRPDRSVRKPELTRPALNASSASASDSPHLRRRPGATPLASHKSTVASPSALSRSRSQRWSRSRSQSWLPFQISLHPTDSLRSLASCASFLPGRTIQAEPATTWRTRTPIIVEDSKPLTHTVAAGPTPQLRGASRRLES